MRFVHELLNKSVGIPFPAVANSLFRVIVHLEQLDSLEGMRDSSLKVLSFIRQHEFVLISQTEGSPKRGAQSLVQLFSFRHLLSQKYHLGS